jgi:hypothetical protein
MKTSRTTKQTIASLPILIALTVTAQTPRASRQTADFFVSPQGQDRWSGRLANPGREYLVYLADGGDVTIDLTAASSKLTVEWIHPTEGTILPGEPISGGARRSFQSPFGSNAVLHLKTHKPKEEN